MKVIQLPFLLVLLFLFQGLNTGAQISITESDMPDADDVFWFSNAAIDNLNFDPLNTGADTNWDFSTLNSQSQDIYEYKNSLSTPYFFYFFNKIGLKNTSNANSNTIVQLDDQYTFYTKNNSVFKAEGIGYTYESIPLSSSYNDEDEIYQFPLQYEDIDSSSFEFDYDLSLVTNDIDYVQSGKRINNVDGWGSITTPFATYSDVLRVKTIILNRDSFNLFSFPVVVDRTDIVYKWLSNSEKIPVLEIIGTEINGNYNITAVKYRDDERMITAITQSTNFSNNLSVYPNPFNNLVNVKTGVEGLSYQMVNQLGEIIKQDELSGDANQINLTDHPSGIYILKINDNKRNTVTINKLIKISNQ